MRYIHYTPIVSYKQAGDLIPKLKPCPFCKGRMHIEECDSEGELFEEGMEGYADVYYRITHHLSDVPRGQYCPVAMHEDEGLGVWVYLTREGAVEAWNDSV